MSRYEVVLSIQTAKPWTKEEQGAMLNAIFQFLRPDPALAMPELPGGFALGVGIREVADPSGSEGSDG